ncbi:MAG TPA: hypothetical protein VIG80_04870 [Bacillaceae bacterium]
MMILQHFVFNMPFLYFPEDKSEYIPAAITMVIFGIGAVLTFFLIKKISRKQEMKTKEMEDQINNERKREHP